MSKAGSAGSPLGAVVGSGDLMFEDPSLTLAETQTLSARTGVPASASLNLEL